MIKTTQKELKQTTNAIDISYNTKEEMDAIKTKENYFDIIAYAPSQYGVAGYLLQGHNTKQLYKIVGRTTAIYLI